MIHPKNILYRLQCWCYTPTNFFQNLAVTLSRVPWRSRCCLQGWVCTHRLGSPNCLDVYLAICTLTHEDKLLRDLKATGFRWSLKLVGEALSCDNAVGVPSVVYGWVSGLQLKWNAK